MSRDKINGEDPLLNMEPLRKLVRFSMIRLIDLLFLS